MILHSLQVSNFRGIREVSLDFRARGITLIDGHNESGKTSLVEAFSFLLNHPSSSEKRDMVAAQRIGTTAPIEVSAELTLGDERVRYTKCFKRRGADLKHRTELRFIEPVKPTLSDREAHTYVLDRLEDAANLKLWDKLRVEQSKEDQQLDSLAEIGALKRALDAEAGEALPTDDDSLFQVVSALRERYFGKGDKPVGDFKKLTDEVDELRRTRDDARREADDLAEDIARLGKANADIARKEELVADAAAELEVADAAADNLRVVENEYQRFAQQHELAKANAAAARSDSERRATLRTQVEDDAGTAREMQTKREQLADEIDELQATAEAARSATEKATRTADEARKAVSTAVARVELVEVARSLREKRERQRRDEELSQRLAEMQATLEQIPATETYVKELRAAESLVRERRAAVHAATSRIEVSGEGSAIVDGTAVDAADGWQGYADRPTDIVVGSVTVGVRPPHNAGDAQRDLEQAESTFTALLAEHGYATVAQAEDALRDGALVAEQLAGVKGQITALWGNDTSEANAAAIVVLQRRADELTRQAPGLAEESEIEEDTPVPRAPVLPDLDASEPHEVEALLARLREARAVAESAAETAEECRRSAEERGTVARERFDRAQWEAESLEQRVVEAAQKEANSVAALRAARESSSDEDLDSAMVVAEKSLLSLEEAAVALTQRLEDARLTARQHDVAASRDALNRHRGELDELKNVRTRLQSRIEVVSEHGLASVLGEAEADLAEARGRLDSMSARAESARLLHAVLESHRAAALRRYSEPLRRELLRYGRLIFGADFDLSLTDDLSVSARRIGDTTVAYEQLSGGAREQFALLTRIVCAELAGGNTVPVFLDDTLGYTDPERRRAMARVITEASEHTQIIVLTCDEERFKHLGRATRHSMSYLESHGGEG